MFLVSWHPCFCHPLPENHRFPMIKYDLLPQQLIYEGTIKAEQLQYPQPCSDNIIRLTHTADYLNKLNQLNLTVSEIRKTGFPLSHELVIREKIIAQGTINAALSALQNNIAFNAAGGTHHAFPDKGEGFCLLNDMAIAANYLLSQKLVNKILIIDLDVHQGNGTANIFRNSEQVFTFSMHGKKNYPLHKEQSNVDIELEDNTNDEIYLSLLTNQLNQIYTKVKPQFVFYQAGVDILMYDKLGRLNISPEGCKERDRIVMEFCKNHEIPITITMGGGYSPNISSIIEAHANTYRMANFLYL